jgi:hypothetical protein
MSYHAQVSEPADEKLLMTNTSHEPEEQRPPKPIRIILPREVCTTPEETARFAGIRRSRMSSPIGTHARIR